MWQLQPTDQFGRDRSWYEKKRSNELAAVLNNLARYLVQLKSSKNAACVQAGFLHTEGKGVLAVDERAGGAGLEATRLYFYSHENSKTIHLITIGNKESQQSDVNLCHEFVLKNFPPTPRDSK
jgi:hypothetical protein